MTNTVYIGWSAASKLYLQVDATNFTDNWPIDVTGTAAGLSATLAVASGGTGGTTQATARSGLGIGSMATRAVTISTAGPSGGADGDVWLQYA